MTHNFIMSISSSAVDALLDDVAIDDVSILSDPSLPESLDCVSVSNNRNLIGAAIITAFPSNPEADLLKPHRYFLDTTGLEIWCGQFEKGGHTDCLHLHIYMQWSNKHRKRFSAIVSAFKNATGKQPNIQICRRATKKSRACAVNYVLKPMTRLGDEWQYIWPYNSSTVRFDPKLWGQKPDKKPEKQDLTETQRKWIESKPKWWTWDQLVHENNESKALLCTCSWGKTYHSGRHAECGRRDISDVIIYYGAGGTGKTTLALSFDEQDGEVVQERYYRRNTDDGQFWGGGRTAYKNQRIIHFEEFCGQEPFARIKEVCDIGKAGPSVNIKNGGTELNHNTVIFTSNHHPAGWYHRMWGEDPKQFHPFWRRITKVLFFPAHRPDGSSNIPDDSTPPFFIDQTEEWKSFKGDYDASVCHADKHWPLKTDGNGSVSAWFNPPVMDARFT